MRIEKHRTRRGFSLGVLCFLCLFVVSEPLRIANASLTKSSMPCCAGKAAGHCDAGITTKKVPPPKSEPMCGLKGAELEEDGITIVAKPIAEPQHSHSQAASSSQPAAERASFSRPCHMDCGTCATASSRQQKRDRDIVLLNTHQVASVTTSSQYEDRSLLLSSSDNWSQINPRGPPARR